MSFKENSFFQDKENNSRGDNTDPRASTPNNFSVSPDFSVDLSSVQGSTALSTVTNRSFGEFLSLFSRWGSNLFVGFFTPAPGFAPCLRFQDKKTPSKKTMVSGDTDNERNNYIQSPVGTGVRKEVKTPPSRVSNSSFGKFVVISSAFNYWWIFYSRLWHSCNTLSIQDEGVRQDSEERRPVSRMSHTEEWTTSSNSGIGFHANSTKSYFHVHSSANDPEYWMDFSVMLEVSFKTDSGKSYSQWFTDSEKNYQTITDTHFSPCSNSTRDCYIRAKGLWTCSTLQGVRLKDRVQ